MRRRIWLLRAVYATAVCAGTILCIVSFLVYDQMQQEVETLERAYALVYDQYAQEADVLLAKLDTTPLGRFRAWVGYEHPYTLVLRGTVKIERGEYGEAIRYLSKSREACTDTRFGAWFCQEFRAEVLFRMGNASMLLWQNRAFTQAMKYFEQGLMLQPDDTSAKKSLEWLKLFEEEIEKGEKEKGKKPDRGPHLLEKPKESQDSKKARRGF
ncbi:MAG: hypothetical protein U1A25_01125 [Candidatus Sungbacteria bacterium]|nr:hypothetical protein [bacterium]MDZ4260241.1 hypothetical protein [Candidatus Sungbacteria bacterium]